MPAPSNPVKAALLRGDMQFGAFLDLASPAAAEIAGGAGFDWCLIDAEHGPGGKAATAAQLVALAAAGCPALIRVPVNEPWVLKQVLDLGAQTVLVPMVDTGAEAATAARATRYPPTGTRGLAAGIVRASGYGAQADYAQTANDQICLMVQAESRAAVDNIDAIAATDGVDCVFVGPSDLAADMGYLGTSAPEVDQAIAHVIGRTLHAGKAAGIFCTDPGKFQAYKDMGVTVIAVSSDVSALRGALTARVAEARKLLG
jgi:4-hydroxy-2-oxoheptanedioate aldolase